MSNTFMDALMEPGHKKAPPKQVKKRPALNLKPSPSVIPSVMVGYFLSSYNFLIGYRVDCLGFIFCK